jgi:hypothetical protein
LESVRTCMAGEDARRTHAGMAALRLRALRSASPSRGSRVGYLYRGRLGHPHAVLRKQTSGQTGSGAAAETKEPD